MIVEVGKLLNEVKTSIITTEKGDKTVLNNRIMIYRGKGRITFVDIAAWGHVAEFIEKYFKQNEEIFIEGELRNKQMILDGKPVQGYFILVNNARIVFGKNIKPKTEEEQ